MENDKRLIDINPIIRNLTAMKSMYDAIALDGMIKALEEAPTVDAADVMRGMWISVKDRKPDRTMPPHDVLVYHDLNCGMFIDRAWYSHEKNKWRSAVGMNLKVTHWMPLPELPEEDKP